jgi:hypothetical protein
MTCQINKSNSAATLPHIVVFCLVSLIIVMSFGLASSSWFLGDWRETLANSLIGEAGIEFRYPHSVVALYTEGHTAPPAAVVDWPSSVRKTPALPPEGKNLATFDGRPVGAGSSSNFEPPSGLGVNPTVQEASDPFSVQADPTDKPAASEESAPVSMPPPSQLANASSAVLPPPMPALPIPDEERDRLFEAFGTQHPQHAKLDKSGIAAHQTTPVQPVQNRRADQHPLGAKAAFQYRIKKECGPIHDPQLRRDCISSFRTYHW